MVAAWCWKLGNAYCGFGDVEGTKPGLISVRKREIHLCSLKDVHRSLGLTVSSSNNLFPPHPCICLFYTHCTVQDPEWEDDELAAEAREHRMHSSKIEELENSITETLRLRQERRHRLTVFAKQIIATECPRTSTKTKKELAFLTQVLEEDRNCFFCDFSEKEREFMLDVVRKDDTVQKGDVLFTVGDVGAYFYIIEKGSIDIMEGHSTGTINTKTLTKGDSFGEIALLFDVPRITSARARTDCVLWKMHQHCFRAKIAYHAMNKEEEMVGCLRRVSLFANIEDVALRKFANSMELVKFKADQRIVNKGDVGNMFYIIDSGTVLVHGIGAGDSQSTDLVLKAGEWFGERSLLTGEPRYAHCTAQTEVSAWAVDRETFETSFGPLQEVISQQMKKRLLKVIPIFAESDVNPSEMDLLTDKMQELCLKKGHHFDEVGKPHRQELVIIEHGRITVYDGNGEDGGKVFTLKNGDYYGDKHIRDYPPKESTLNVVCEENTTVWSISRKDLENILGNLNRLGQSVSFKVQRRVSTYSKRIPQKDLERIKVLGHGGFGKVWLVKHKTSGVHYALKELNKRRIIEKKQTKNVLREKEILATLDHPFILGEVSSFQDEASCYILMDLVQGGELYTQIVNTKGKGLPLQGAVFYGACIHCALAHFHARLVRQIAAMGPQLP